MPELTDLTEETIDSLEAGWHLNNLIYTSFDFVACMPFSQDIESAFLVVNDLTKPGREPQNLHFRLWYREDIDDDAWVAFDWKRTSDPVPLYHARAKTIPLAICRAALKVWLAEQLDRGLPVSPAQNH